MTNTNGKLSLGEKIGYSLGDLSAVLGVSQYTYAEGALFFPEPGCRRARRKKWVDIYSGKNAQ